MESIPKRQQALKAIDFPYQRTVDLVEMINDTKKIFV